jgi:hypothetical protein
MRVTSSITAVLSVTVMTFALASAAHAASSRTYVSNAGNDSNTASNCGHPAPCATFAAAYSVTSSGGEIVALDVAGYGPVTITGPVTLTGIDGALVNVATGTVGITISAGAGNVVILRNLKINGQGTGSSTTGIKLNTGKVVIENCLLRNLTDGFIADSTGNSNAVLRAYLTNTDIIANLRAITTNGSGANLQVGSSPHTGNVEVLIWGGNILTNGTAFQMNNPGSSNGNNFDTMWLGGVSNGVPNTNVTGNTVVAAGTPTSSGGDCEFGCKGLRIYLPSSATTNYDPGP